MQKNGINLSFNTKQFLDILNIVLILSDKSQLCCGIYSLKSFFTPSQTSTFCCKDYKTFVTYRGGSTKLKIYNKFTSRSEHLSVWFVFLLTGPNHVYW